MVRVSLAVVAVAGVLPGLVAGHGWMKEPKARVEYCHSGKNQGCGQIKYEPQSVEGPDGYPDSGPPDGELASGGPNSRFPELDQQGADRWYKTKISPGEHTFEWYLQANHVTKDFRYFITKPGWNQNAPLTRNSFYPTPFCHHDFGNKMPPVKLTHKCTIPATHSGYHVVFAIWQVGDTPNSFFNVLDLDISGSGSGPAPPVVTNPPPPTNPAPGPGPSQPTGSFTPRQGCGAMALQTGDSKIQVAYELGTTNGQKAVQFTLRFPSNGYGSIGFRAAGGSSMGGLDLMTVDSRNKAVVDSETVQYPSRPAPDAQQDVVLVSHQNMGSYTEAKFFRKLNTGNDFKIYTGRPIGFAWAYGSGFGNNIAYHQGNARAMDVTLEQCASSGPGPTPPSNGQCMNDARFPGFELCQNAPNCCKGGSKCYSYGNQMSFCLPFCPAGWSCNDGSCQKQGDYLRCEGNDNCCPSNTKCYSFDGNIKYCLASCPAGWACENQAPPQLPPAPKPTTCQTVQGNGAVWELCKGDENCCASGKMCYVYTNQYSFCMDSCPAGWGCQSSNPGPAPKPQPQYNNGDCGVCRRGTGCYMKTSNHAECRKNCPAGWECNKGNGQSPPATTPPTPQTPPTTPQTPPTTPQTPPATTPSTPSGNGNTMISLDFENEAVNTIPSGWQTFVSYNINSGNAAQKMHVDTTRARSGSKSFKVTSDASGAQIAKKLEGNPKRVYFRAFYWLEKSLGNMQGDNHEHIMGTKKDNNNPGHPFGADAEIRVGQSKGHLGFNQVPTDAVSPPMSKWYSGPQIPARKWTCVEAGILADKAYDEMHMWVDDQLVNSVTKASDWHYDIKADWAEELMGFVFFGWQSFSSRSMTMWIDDIVVSDSRIGC